MTISINGVAALTPAQIRDALLSLPEDERKFIVTEPEGGDHKVYTVHINAAGNIAGNSEATAE